MSEPTASAAPARPDESNIWEAKPAVDQAPPRPPLIRASLRLPAGARADLFALAASRPPPAEAEPPPATAPVAPAVAVASAVVEAPAPKPAPEAAKPVALSPPPPPPPAPAPAPPPAPVAEAAPPPAPPGPAPVVSVEKSAVAVEPPSPPPAPPAPVEPAPKPAPVVAKVAPVVAKVAPVVAKVAPVVAKVAPVVAKVAPVVAEPAPEPEPPVVEPPPPPPAPPSEPPAPVASVAPAPPPPPPVHVEPEPAKPPKTVRAALESVVRKPAPKQKRLDRPRRPTPMSPDDAVRHLARAYQEVQGEPASPAVLSVLWAQWALETGRGRWMMDYNYAGLKGRAPDGGVGIWSTWEETDDGPRRVRARFRSYESPEHGAWDYVNLLSRRYPRAMTAARRGDAVLFILELDAGGFFTERPKHYVRSVASLAYEFRREKLAERCLSLGHPGFDGKSDGK